MKEKIKQIIAEFVYRLYKLRILKNEIKVMSIDETLDRLLSSNLSLVRLGDGELQLIEGNAIPLQDMDKKLSQQLYQLLMEKSEDILIAIPDIFDGLESYTPKSQKFWKEHLLFFRKRYQKYCTDPYLYGNSLMSRCYYMMGNKQICSQWFEKTKRLWENKKVVVVEGEVSRNGVDNDLFDNVLSLERMICPSRNAYQVYDKIKEACLRYSKDTLFLLSVGAVSKPLVKELVERGYRALDIGSLDMEYYWYLEGVDYKKHPPKRDYQHTDETKTPSFEKYLTQIKCVIEE